MPSPKRIVVDTSAFYALISSTDAFHTQAKLSYERLIDWEWELWTTSYVLVETSALVHHRLGFEALKVFTETILSGVAHILWIENVIHNEAWKRLAARQGKSFSLVDWTTVVTSERLNASVFTFDLSLRQEGVLVFPRYSQ